MKYGKTIGLIFMIMAMAAPSVWGETWTKDGYTLIDSNESNGPVFGDLWLELTELPVGSKSEVVLENSDMSSAKSIGFEFTFFGTPYTTYSICSEGLITFTAGQSSASAALQEALPNPGGKIKNIIAALWSNLSPGG